MSKNKIGVPDACVSGVVRVYKQFSTYMYLQLAAGVYILTFLSKCAL